MLLETDNVLLVRLQARIIDKKSVRGRFQGGSDEASVVGCFASAKMKGLEATMGEPAVKGGWYGTDGILKEAETLFELRRVEGRAAHENVLGTVSLLINTVREEEKAHGMSIDVLCDRMYDDIRTVVQGVLYVGAEKGVVHYNHYAVLVCYGCDFSNVNQAQRRIAG